MGAIVGLGTRRLMAGLWVGSLVGVLLPQSVIAVALFLAPGHPTSTYNAG